MTHVRTMVFAALSVSMLPVAADVGAQTSRQLSPKAAEQYASDSEKAKSGDPDAAYRLGEALESGRLGGLKDLNKALLFYRQAAAKGHEPAATRLAQIEADLRESDKNQAPPSAQGK